MQFTRSTGRLLSVLLLLLVGDSVQCEYGYVRFTDNELVGILELPDIAGKKGSVILLLTRFGARFSAEMFQIYSRIVLDCGMGPCCVYSCLLYIYIQLIKAQSITRFLDKCTSNMGLDFTSV